MHFLSATLVASWASLVLASTPGVDIEVQLLFNSSGTEYPTDFTRDIVPKFIHSHNDYWRDVPVYTALSYGVISIEADVWLVNGTLYIGHEVQALTPNRTFDGLYIQPLVKILTGQNPVTPFTQATTLGQVGVFDRDGSQTLYLFIDVKTDGQTTWPSVVEALQPLREKGWLSKVNGSNVIKGPITVVGTGNTPLNQLVNNNTRDYFFDAPLGNLNSTFTPTLSPIASGDYEVLVGWNGLTPLNDTITQTIQKQVNDAHAAGLMTRYWDTPLTPIFARNAVWSALLEQGSDLLNGDDLEAAANF